ncbi:transglutaminase-like domain-containing protein [Sulfurospirillum cavolei]|uniref:transglutaminase-like domain-containing protein n=1 Tax=Sulfurospirillum cavolei TaxID=366522 RepID=UPI000764BCAC|nr:transglutaminase family protein [Sulfurospirillum cavolei]
MAPNEAYLQNTSIIDWLHPRIVAKAKELRGMLRSDVEIANNCFTFVRDHIHHTGDHKSTVITCKASDVLVHQTGWCFAKSHLLAALCRANGIPAGFCYQRLSLFDNGEPYTLHGFNALYLNDFGWYRVDARGNKAGVNATFSPPLEQLAFRIKASHEIDFQEILSEPLSIVITALQTYTSFEESLKHLPDCTEITPL